MKLKKIFTNWWKKPSKDKEEEKVINPVVMEDTSVNIVIKDDQADLPKKE